MEVYTYSCDECHEQKNWDEEIIWITSTYGLCHKCHSTKTEKELEELELFYE